MVVAALATAIAMMASVGIMVGSFRETVALWLDVQLRADLYVRPAVPSAAGEYPPLASSIPARIAGIPGVAAVDDFHAVELHYRGDRATFGAGNLEIVRRYGRLRFLPGEDRDAILRSLPGRDRAIVSEPFANLYGVRAGDRLRLPLGDREARLDSGRHLLRVFEQPGLRDCGPLHLPALSARRSRPPTPRYTWRPARTPTGCSAKSSFARRDWASRWRPTASCAAAAIEIFDRTFAITWALEAVAILVAMLGAANSLLALVLDRRRELACCATWAPPPRRCAA